MPKIAKVYIKQETGLSIHLNLYLLITFIGLFVSLISNFIYSAMFQLSTGVTF